MDKEYYLDMKTLLQILGRSSAILQTKLVSPKTQEQCLGRVFVRNGQVLECLIAQSDGRLIAAYDEAQEQLRSPRPWQVRLEPNIEVTLKVVKRQMANTYFPHPLTAVQVPQQKNVLTPASLQQFKRRDRIVLQMVLAIINGKRSIDEIKHMLNLLPERVEAAITILCSLEVISFKAISNISLQDKERSVNS